MGQEGIASVILASRRSSRMGGGDKALLPLGARPMLAHGLWPFMLRNELARFLASGRKARVTDFVTEHQWRAVDFDMKPLPERYLDPFFNINTPDDLYEAERVAELLP